MAGTMLGEVWMECLDASSGKCYYVNTETQDTTWDVPEDIADLVAQKAGAWEEKEDPESGKSYFFNTVTNETTWDRPAELAAAAGGGDDEWEEKSDPDTGKVYYFNKATRETSWTKPGEEPEEGADDATAPPGEDAEPEEAAAAEDSGRLTAAAEGATSNFAKLKGARDGAKGARSSVLEKKKRALLAKKGVKLEATEEEVLVSEETTMERYAEDYFNLKRKGMMKSETSVDKILSWKKDLIKTSLHQFSDELVADSVQAFKNVTGYMSDRKSKKTSVDHAKKLMRNVLPAPIEVRDEVFCQIIKQTTNNPDSMSTLRGWQLMVVCLGCFPPSPKFAPFLKTYCINTQKQEDKAQEVIDYAKYAEDHIGRIMHLGARTEVPVTEELEVAEQLEPWSRTVHFLDGTFKEIEITPWTTGEELSVLLAEDLGILNSDPFSVFECCLEKEEERILEKSEVIGELYALWEKAELDERAKKGKNAKIDAMTLVYKVHMFTHVDGDNEADKEAAALMYMQAVHDVTDSRYPAEEQDLITLAALQCEQEHGDYSDGHSHFEDGLDHYLPATLLNQGRDEELEERINKVYQKLTGYTPGEAQLSYLDMVQSWEIYGSEYFFAEGGKNTGFADQEVVIAVNSKAVIIVEPETKEFLKTHAYKEVVTWGNSSKTFVLVVGSVAKQQKLYFNTEQGKEINDLVALYVHALADADE